MTNIIHGDCLDVMKGMEENSIDFIVTDPPYGLNFMGKKWDSKVPNVEIWKEALRVCKPGSMLGAFGCSRTHHHLMIALEQGGWEIRDVIMWLYGSGFPKSHNRFGLEGYGTALKPAYEPIILAMKPVDGTYARNVDNWGIGGINIDGSRIGNESTLRPNSCASGVFVGKVNPKQCNGSTKGRWPANIILDEESGQMLDNQTGVLKKIYDEGDSGGASRFFYCAKVSSKERGKENTHPTVKPISVMKYIIKLLSPPNNPILLDPFCGSGSTLLASKELGIRYIGIEKEQQYVEIAMARVA